MRGKYREETNEKCSHAEDKDDIRATKVNFFDAVCLLILLSFNPIRNGN